MPRTLSVFDTEIGISFELNIDQGICYMSIWPVLGWPITAVKCVRESWPTWLNDHLGWFCDVYTAINSDQTSLHDASGIYFHKNQLS